MNPIDRLVTLPQYVAPQHTLSDLAWKIARCKNTAIKEMLIRAFMLRYDVDLAEAARPHIKDYASFNDFFTRSLRAGSRPMPSSGAALACPADGTISQLGPIENDRLLQAKGRGYSLPALLAGDERETRQFTHGSFATIYLAPHNYHRVHVPVSGTVSKVRFIPGRLFSVNDRTARCVDDLFARNERIVVEMQTAAGAMAVILVGAMLVASMELTCCDVPAAIPSPRDVRQPVSIRVPSNAAVLDQGAELGRFNMGSTVIILAQPGKLNWNRELSHGAEVRVGQAIASLNEPVSTARAADI